MTFDFEDLLAEASQRTGGLQDFGPEDFREPMRRLLAALEEEADLNEMGRVTQRERILGLLVARLRTEEYIERYPEILDEKVGPSFSIIGLGRTGTTMLHRMLSSDDRLFSLRWYESRNPAPLPGSDGSEEVDPRIRDAEAEIEMMLEASPELIAAHPMDAHAPDEEIMLLEHAFMSGNPEAFCSVPKYARRLEDEDATPGYAYMDRLLCFLQWQKKRAGQQADRWVLKTPHHIGFLAPFFEIFPEAKVVLTHRDPIQTIPSMCSLIHSIRVLNSDRVDQREIGEQWSSRLVRMMDRCIDLHDQFPDRFLDLQYRDLIADPMVGARQIYDFVGMAWTPEAEAGMREWAVENSRDKRPVHSYTLEQYGFTEEGLRKQFARYYERFIDPEL